MTTQHRKDIILQYHKTHTRKELAEMLCCCTNRISQLTKELGVKCKPEITPQAEPHHEYIVANAATMTPQQMANELGISYWHVYHHCERNAIAMKVVSRPVVERLSFQWLPA